MGKVNPDKVINYERDSLFDPWSFLHVANLYWGVIMNEVLGSILGLFSILYIYTTGVPGLPGPSLYGLVLKFGVPNAPSMALMTIG